MIVVIVIVVISGDEFNLVGGSTVEKEKFPYELDHIKVRTAYR